jgi:hypothetical protein
MTLLVVPMFKENELVSAFAIYRQDVVAICSVFWMA